MKPTISLIALALGFMLISSCSMFDDRPQNLSIDETILSSTQIVEISKATKLINTLALQEILKNENFAGSHFRKNTEADLRGGNCPNITPDPKDYNPLVKTDYTLEFSQCTLSDQLLRGPGTPVIIGTMVISLEGEIGHSDCKFRIFGNNLSIGAVKYRDFDITQIHDRQITSDNCNKRDILDFATIINVLEFSATGLSAFGEKQDILKVVNSTNARTSYKDYNCNTDIDNFATIMDDKIVIKADTLVSGFVEDDKILSRNIFTDVEAEFDLICPCPIRQSFNIIQGGVSMLTCFDEDSEACDDNLTCLTTTIKLDCRS